MESWLKEIAEGAGLALEIVVVLVVLLGGLRALVQLATASISRSLDTPAARAIWVDFATSILLALEFALGADIIDTAVAPTWDDIGQLASIAAIRTGLGFFLGRDIEVFGSSKEVET
jgi:uncharacterized membrane protein